MKDLTRKVLESGLINKHTAVLMEKWGYLEPGASDMVGKIQGLNGPTAVTLESNPFKKKEEIRRVLEDFVEDLELLLQPESLERDITNLDKSGV